MLFDKNQFGVQREMEHNASNRNTGICPRILIDILMSRTPMIVTLRTLTYIRVVLQARKISPRDREEETRNSRRRITIEFFTSPCATPCIHTCGYRQVGLRVNSRESWNVKTPGRRAREECRREVSERRRETAPPRSRDESRTIADGCVGVH